MAEEELQIEETTKKSKLPLIAIIVVALLGAGGAAWYFLFSGSDEPVVDEATTAQSAEATGEQSSSAGGSAKVGTALYVAMPRPFTFNVPGSGRDRLVQIKVQLMVRGSDNEETAKMHIPLIEGTLLQVFSGSTADELITEAGKVALREQAVSEVQKVMNETAGTDVIEQVLFTGFVMQ